MKNWKMKLLTIGTKICAFSVILSALLAPTCRDNWYQPEEPENLDELLKTKRNNR